VLENFAQAYVAITRATSQIFDKVCLTIEVVSQPKGSNRDGSMSRDMMPYFTLFFRLRRLLRDTVSMGSPNGEIDVRIAKV